ncbi:MAG TPA: ComEC/Rec2 family competence protein, partial [Candidatus Babeliales bacterium]|nr:ComEC/Rec2 family competence protein [Candidatus Babeliales bacterium]
LTNFKNRLITKLKSKLTPATFSLLSTVFLGYKLASPPLLQQQLTQQFQRWGLAHFLARAGLHLILLAFLLQASLLLLLRSRAGQQCGFLVAVSIYALLSWDSLSFERAWLLVSLVAICQLGNWQYDRLHLLNLITSAILLWNPVQLFFLDFQLSFALTYALVLVFRQNRYQIIAPL